MSQFAISKAAVLARPRDFWIALRDPLMRQRTAAHPWREHVDAYRIGRYFESIWHILMGKPALYCPPRDLCNAVFFSNRIRCDKDPAMWPDADEAKNNTCDYHGEGLPAGQPAIGPLISTNS